MVALLEEQGDEPGGLTRRQLIERGLASGAGLAVAGAIPAQALARAAGVTPKRGGRLRVGIVGGGSSESLAAARGAANEIDYARRRQLYGHLADLAPDGRVVPSLAQEFSPNKDGSVWKIKVRPGITWHDGARFTADDIVYSIRYIVNPANKAVGRTTLSFINPSKVRSLDASTVEVRLQAPLADLATPFSSPDVFILKRGTTDAALDRRPIGTGPFKFESFARGRSSVFVRNDDYWQDGLPYIDSIEIVSINDPTARVNALLAGQVDAIAQVPANLARTVTSRQGFALLRSHGGQFTAYTMSLASPVFADPRVRRAFRLLCDRNQLVSIALSGYGTIANDLPCPLDVNYAKEIPQIPYDPEQAKSLLAQAGVSNLEVSLATSEVGPGMLQGATLLAEQAKKAGVTISIVNAPADQFWTSYWKNAKYPFSSTTWGYRPLDAFTAVALTAGGASNETDWSDAKFGTVVAQARQTLNAQRRRALWVDAQRLLWDHGGYIIPMFVDILDGRSSKVRGLTSSRVRPLNYYDFTKVSMA